MTPTSDLPAPVLPWHRTVAWMGVAWGACELGAFLWVIGSESVSGQASFGFTSAMAFLGLSALATLVLPAGLLLLRRCLSLAAYQLAVLPPALAALLLVLMLLSLLLNVGYGQGPDLPAMTVLLGAILARGALTGALSSASRQRARMYGSRSSTRG